MDSKMPVKWIKVVLKLPKHFFIVFEYFQKYILKNAWKGKLYCYDFAGGTKDN